MNVIILQIIVIIFAVIGAILNIHKNKLCFLYWTVANIGAMILCFHTKLYLLILIQIFYSVLNVIGWKKWGKGKSY